MDEVENEQTVFNILLLKNMNKPKLLSQISLLKNFEKTHLVDEIVDSHAFCFVPAVIDDFEANRTIDLASLSKIFDAHDNWNNPCGLDLMFRSYDVSKLHCSFLSQDEFSQHYTADAIKSAQSLYFSDKALSQAMDCTKDGQFAKALQLLQEACDCNKRNWEAFLLRAEIVLKAGDKKAALVDVEYVLKGDEGNETALRILQSLQEGHNVLFVNSSNQNGSNEQSSFDPIIHKLHESLSHTTRQKNHADKSDVSDTSSNSSRSNDSGRKKKRKKKHKKHKKKHKKQKVEED